MDGRKIKHSVKPYTYTNDWPRHESVCIHGWRDCMVHHAEQYWQSTCDRQTAVMGVINSTAATTWRHHRLTVRDMQPADQLPCIRHTCTDTFTPQDTPCAERIQPWQMHLSDIFTTMWKFATIWLYDRLLQTPTCVQCFMLSSRQKFWQSR